MRLAPLAFLLSVAAVDFAQAETRPFSVRDLIAFDRLSAPAVSPDGRHVAYTVSALDLDANKRRTDLWLMNVDGSGAPRRLTTHDASDGQAAWSPDGRSIYFLSARSGSSQVWRLPVDGGEAEAVTKLPLDVGAFRLSPDGKLLSVALDVFVDCADLACTSKRLADVKAKKSTGRLYDQLLFRHWDEWADGRRAHVFIMPVAGTAPPVDLLRGVDADSPSKPFGGDEEFAFTPDGKQIVFSARVAGREEAWSTNFDLFVVPVDGSAKPRNLTASNPAWDTQPVFSPDGKSMVYLAMAKPGYEADRRRVLIRSFPDGKDRVIAEAWDRSPDSLSFSRDGQTLYATAEHLGNQGLFAIDVASGKVKALVEKGHAVAPRLAGAGKDERIVFLLDNLRAPAELHTMKLDGTEPRAITATNAARLAEVRLGETEQFTFKGWNAETVHAWMVKPADFVAGRKYPIAYLIHGGPQGSFMNQFHYRWNPQTYAAAGYVAVMVDFHGSQGYGQAFSDAIRDDWGGKPLEDLQKGLDAAVKKYPFIDGDRACALGASYGGFMVNWIAGKWPDRFRCLVTHDGNLDERMAYFDTEELWFPEWDHNGTPWENPAGYSKHNPIDLVKNWKSPTLVIHGGRDFRVVDTQGMSTFTALKRRGIPSRFLHFPDENHWVLSPHNSILWHDTVLDWLNRWAGTGAAAAR